MMILLDDNNVHVSTIGPELVNINREGLQLTLNLEGLKQSTPEDWDEMENRISAKLSAKMSNLTSP